MLLTISHIHYFHLFRCSIFMPRCVQRHLLQICCIWERVKSHLLQRRRNPSVFGKGLKLVHNWLRFSKVSHYHLTFTWTIIWIEYPWRVVVYIDPLTRSNIQTLSANFIFKDVFIFFMITGDLVTYPPNALLVYMLTGNDIQPWTLTFRRFSFRSLSKFEWKLYFS